MSEEEKESKKRGQGSLSARLSPSHLQPKPPTILPKDYKDKNCQEPWAVEPPEEQKHSIWHRIWVAATLITADWFIGSSPNIQPDIQPEPPSLVTIDQGPKLDPSLSGGGLKSESLGDHQERVTLTTAQKIIIASDNVVKAADAVAAAAKAVTTAVVDITAVAVAVPDAVEALKVAVEALKSLINELPKNETKKYW